jgi:chorismate dehydratase
MSRLRISAISYLNTAPLMWDFEHGVAEREFDISYTIPSACARALEEGTADIGIIPAAAYTTIANLAIVPDVAIAAQRAVRSILLVSKVPIDKIQTVALDTSSMTSVALLKILFAKWLGGPRTYSAMPPNLEEMLARSDAALIIGDPALQTEHRIDRTRFITLDLAEEWIARTGKPFVFAFWAIRKQALSGHDPGAISEVFKKSRDHGLQRENLEVIARDWSRKLDLSIEFVRSYLVRNIHYYLDPPCLSGLSLFYRYGVEIGVLSPPPKLDFLDAI